MNDNSIKRQVSEILGILIDNWDEDFKQLDAENRLNTKTQNKILLVILKRLEEMENAK